MIALVIGDLSRGPVPVALERAGLEPRPAESAEQADWDVQNEGEDGCVLVLDAGVLESEDGDDRDWAAFLARHPALPVVVVRAGGKARARLGGWGHRIALADRVDPDTVVTAVRRVAAKAPVPVGLTA